MGRVCRERKQLSCPTLSSTTLSVLQNRIEPKLANVYEVLIMLALF